ncbi:MAG: hypothetical protein ACI9UQ_001564 [Candidatus Krumholzibacteriia bacterium]|jgi:hypothetical protein
MKYLLLIAALGIGSTAYVAQAGQNSLGPHESDLKLQELASIPLGLTVVHTPESIMESTVGPTGLKWAHTTTVSSTVGPVTIVEFGCFYDSGGQWIYATTNKEPYSAENFSQWYKCPNAELQPGQTYTDESNFSTGNSTPAQVTKWYFIGIDAEGNRVKGEAEVALMSEDGC